MVMYYLMKVMKVNNSILHLPLQLLDLFLLLNPSIDYVNSAIDHCLSIDWFVDDCSYLNVDLIVVDVIDYYLIDYLADY